MLNKQISIFNNTFNQFVSKSKLEGESHESKDFIKINNKIQKKYSRLLNTLQKGRMHIIKDLNLTVKMGIQRKRASSMTYHLQKSRLQFKQMMQYSYSIELEILTLLKK